MRYREIMTETVQPRISEELLRTAAEDFVADWIQIRPQDEAREPSPRREFIATLRKQGLDPRKHDVREALVNVMRTESQRLLSSLPWHGNMLTVYRNIGAVKGWERDPASHGDLGVYWSITDDYQNGLTMGRGDGFVFTTIVSAVRDNQVDWNMIILKHLTYSENEIRLKDDTMVPILGVHVWQDGHEVKLDVSHLAGKMFSVGQSGEDD